jgi:hypothetical protein
MLTQDRSFDTANVFVYGYDSPRLGQSLHIASYAAYETEKTFGTVVVPMANALALSNRRPDPFPDFTDCVLG